MICLKIEISFNCRNKGADVNNSICIGANRTNCLSKQKKVDNDIQPQHHRKNNEVPKRAKKRCYSQRRSAAGEAGAVSKRQRGRFEKVRAGRG